MEREDNKELNGTKGKTGKGKTNKGINKKNVIILAVCAAAALLTVCAAAIVITTSGKNRKDSANVNISGETKSIVGSLNLGKDENNSTEELSAENATQPTKEADTEPPVISGVKNRTFNIGDTVTYTSGVSAKDNVDGEVEVEVDKSAVDVKKAGSYKVIYKATDKAGNTARAEATFTFKAAVAQGATYKELSQQLLGQIVDSSMTDGQKIRKIYDYLFSKVYYGARKQAGSTWQEESVLALREILSNGSTRGDCFTSAAVCMAVLETAGAQVQWMQNLGAEVCGSNHVWVLCNVGTGWYHFDITHYSGVPSNLAKRFMYTDAEVEDWMKSTGFNRYIWDKSQHPATPTTQFTY